MSGLPDAQSAGVGGALEPEPFDLEAPLAPGVTVLEASAGTGKTYAITGLAARLVAEGVPLERILLVTFTRMATGELRERVRERLAVVRRGLSVSGASGTEKPATQVSDRQTPGAQAPSAQGPGAKPPDAHEDPVVALLRRRGADAVTAAGALLTRALSDFDAATIATTHGFCQEALAGLGIAADLEPDMSFVEDLRDVVREVLDDLYIKRFYRQGKPSFPRAQALAIAQLAVASPGAAIAPATGEVPQMRRRLAEAVREELEERKRRLSLMTYDDLLVRLQRALTGPDGPAVAARLRARYDVVLVDEFQDTDPVQWEIMRLAFARGDGTVVLIADPKQAIYAFRGADVYAYLDAAGQARRQATLTGNRRSDQQLLDAYDALFANARLGHAGIVYRRVRAAACASPPRLHRTPLRVRLVDRTRVERTPTGLARAPSAREYIAQDLAGDVVGLLHSGAQVALRPHVSGGQAHEPVCPGHVAVLVRTNAQAAIITEALQRAGVPAVINGAGSVFATDTARDWLALLAALERPSSITRAHGVALTVFVGWPAARVAQASEDQWADLHERLHEWARVLRRGGVAALLETVTRQHGVPGRVLGHPDGERKLTDLRHIGQLLHRAASAEQLGTTALSGWLRRRILEAERDSGDEERNRRLESDAQAAQVLTIHRSKGLEFPIVYLPFLWDTVGRERSDEPVAFHDPEAGDQRTIDVALEGPAFDRHRRQALVEQRGEDLRLAYVALTRARHQAVLWWAGSWDARHSPLGRLVFSRGPDGSVPAFGQSTPSDAAARDTFTTLAAQAARRIGVEAAELSGDAAWRPSRPATARLRTAVFGRTLDRRWRRTSYSDITRAVHDAHVASEPEEPVLVDEPDSPAPLAGAVSRPGISPAGPRLDGVHAPLEPPPDGAASAAAQAGSLLSELPVGVGAGTLVHQALQDTDFAAGDLEGQLARALAAAPGRRAVALSETQLRATAAGLRAALETPLGPVMGGRSLCEVTRADRVDELAFELPLAGGDRPQGALTPEAIAAVLAEHLPPGEAMHDYARRLPDQGVRQSVRGFLTGSLDLVVRLPGPDGPRFAVLDYKTNWLGDPEQPLTCWHYRPSALAHEMQARHYTLQALLYLVALHRYLRWRLRGYEPERHLAGVCYVFVRGMIGPSTPWLDGVCCGVFDWQPSGSLVRALGEVLAGGRAS